MFWKLLSWVAVFRRLIAAFSVRVERCLATRLAHGSLLTLVLVWYLWTYFHHPACPTEAFPGWWTSQDQGIYVVTTQALSELDPRPERMKVSIGYPLLAVPFYRWMPEHPFLILNTACVLGITAAFVGIARRFMSRTEAWLATFGIAYLTLEELVTSLIVPWTSIPTHFAAYAMIYVYWSQKPSYERVVALTLLDALAYLCRPGDGAFLAPLVVAAALELPQRRAIVRAAGIAAGALAIVFAADRLLNLFVFDSPLSTYEKGTRGDFLDWDVLARGYAIFVDAMPGFRQLPQRQLERTPYMLFFLPGLVYAAKTLKGQIVAPTLCVALSLGLYLGYNYFFPSAYFDNFILHYIAWTFPLFGLASYLTFRFALHRLSWPTFGLSLAVPLLVLWVVRLEETDPLPVRSSLSGRLLPLEGTASSAGYDTLLLPQGWIDVRTDARRRRRERNPGVGFVYHFSAPTPLATYELVDEWTAGTRAEVRRLAWGLRATPVLLDKWRHGPRATTTEPAPGFFPLHALPADRLVRGRATHDSHAPQTLDSTPGPGWFVEGSPPMSLPRALYRVEWYGRVLASGNVSFQVTRRGATAPLAMATLAVTRGGDDPLVAAFDLRIEDTTDDLEYRVHLDDAAVRLRLFRVELHIADGGQPLPPAPE